MLQKELSQNILNTLLHTNGIVGDLTRQEILDEILAGLGQPGSSTADSAASYFYKDPEHRIKFRNWTYEIDTDVVIGKDSAAEVDTKLDTIKPTNARLVGTFRDIDLQVAIDVIPDSYYGFGLTSDIIKKRLEEKKNEIVTHFVIGESRNLLIFNRARIIGDLLESRVKNTEVYENYQNLQAAQINIQPKSTSKVWQKYEKEEYYYDKTIGNIVSVKVIRYRTVTDPTSYSFPIDFQGFKFEQNRIQNMYFPFQAHLGLFTEMPGVNGGKNFVEIPTQMTENGITYTTSYRRMDLNEGIFSKESVLEQAYKYGRETDETNPDNPYYNYLGYAYTTNKEIIMFPEIVRRDPEGKIKTDTASSWGGWGNIIGFGLFSESSGSEPPYFWGELEKNQEGTVNHVPLFRIKNFQLFLG